MALEVEQTGVSGDFPLASTGTTGNPTVVTMTQIALGYEVTVAYSITPEEVYAGPPGGSPVKPPVGTSSQQ